jgi:hypothetical protein
VPIATTPGRSGFGPQLSLSYNSGAGNGPFGLGWNLSIPSITRKTDKGLPRYQDAGDTDIFILSDAEDLVPCLAENDQEPEVTGEDGRTYLIWRYRPRIEGLFARIERRVDKQNGDTHWQSVSKDNITTVYGRNPKCRLADPRHKSRVFSWLIEESYDDRGNVIVFEYKQENQENIDPSLPQEKNRLAGGGFANHYIKRIKYGNKQPYQRDDWLFQVVFDYGDHHPDMPVEDPDRIWVCRRDAFSTYRAGFEIRTCRLCQRVLMFHHFAELGDNPCLVRSTDFHYAPDPVVTCLASVVQTDYVRDENGLYRKKALPPLEFSYTEPKIEQEIRSIAPESRENLPVGLDGAQYQWLDLDSEGISGILTEQAGAWFYKPNLGNGRFAPVQVVLRQMEQAYLEKNKRDYEITKNISLMLHDPMALITLKESGCCEVFLPESLFDADYPGHYMRRIKSVSLTISCVTGPYTGINCTLTLLSNKTRVKSTPADPYLEKDGEEDDRFVANFAAMQSIATSHAQNDSGMFELNFRDERYLPFEGAGAISRWRIDLPKDCNAFDFNTLSDAILHLKYTAKEGAKF